MQNKNVLVVDDELGILKVLHIKLKLHGYNVIATTSGAEAIELVRNNEPDVILLDILMPVVSGLEVLERVRVFSKVPVIVFSASPKAIEDAVNLGADASILKPFDPDRLVEQIETVLSNHKNPCRSD